MVSKAFLIFSGVYARSWSKFQCHCFATVWVAGVRGAGGGGAQLPVTGGYCQGGRTTLKLSANLYGTKGTP